VTATDGAQQRILEGHFPCGPGLLIDIECLSHSYPSRTPNHNLEITLPTLRAEWQEGFLDPPAWSYKRFSDPEHEIALSDANFEWGVTVGYQNNPEGTQSPEFARVRRWRFETTITNTADKLVYFGVREKFIQELETWWSLASTWISIFTKQDFVETGKTRSGMRVGPIVTWNGGADGLRVNGSKETSIPNVNDEGVEILNHQTLLARTRLAASGTPPPDEWMFVRDARSLVNARQYRRAVIDAGTAAELAMTALIDPTLTGMNLLQTKKLFEKNGGLWELSNLIVTQNAGTRPDRLQQDLAEPRNRAAHDGGVLSETKANAAIAIAADLVAQLHPLTDLLT
jgi:hypothetical protein